LVRGGVNAPGKDANTTGPSPMWSANSNGSWSLVPTVAVNVGTVSPVPGILREVQSGG